MKKLIALLLALMLVLSLAACGNKEENNVENEEVIEDVTEETTEATTEDTTEEVVEDEPHDTSNDLPFVTPDGEIIDIDDMGDYINGTEGATETVSLLQTIWALYGDEEKFPVMGGNPEAGVMDMPGVYDMAYAEGLSSYLLIPADQMTNVTEAATMIHMMNTNTFTGGVVKLADGVDVAAFAQVVRDAIQGNQWICGFPETMIIADLSNGCVLISYGVNDTMSVFQAKLTEAFAGAQILFNEAISG